MRKLLSSLCASALAASFALSSALPLNAAPLRVPAAQSAPTQSDVIQVQDRGERMIRRMGPPRRDFGERRVIRRDFSRGDVRDVRRVVRRDVRRDFERRGNYAWYKGHRGYRYYRPGYREHNGFWFPAAAFVAGAIISGAIANQPRAAYGSSHVQWCYDRYRSYRAYDNSFQPYNGPRQQCYSPYS